MTEYPGGVLRSGGMTVLYTLDGVGEAEREAVELGSRFDEFRVVFCALTPAAEAVAPGRGLPGTDVVRCPLGPRFPVAFHRLLRELRPRVVQSRAASYTPAVLTAARVAGVGRRVVQLSASAGHRTGPAREGAYGGMRDGVRDRLRRAADRMVLDAWATDLVGASESVMRRVWGENWRTDPRCRLIYPGIEIEPYGVAIAARRRALDLGEGGQDMPLTVLHIGSPGPADNRSRAVDVLVALRGRGVDARLRFAGRWLPLEQEAVLAQAARRGVGAYVEFVRPGTGTGTDEAKLVVSASILLLPAASDQGELPRPVLAACAVGTPVLASDLPAVREIATLLPGVTMLPLGADDEVWADAARALTTVPPTLDERREALRVFVRSPFTAESWQREMVALWS